MFEDNTQLRRRLTILAAGGVIFLTALIAYATQNNSFAPLANSQTPPIINPEVLQNWLPNSSYHTTQSQIQNYLKSNSLTAKYLTVQGNVSTGQGAYNFTLLLQPQQEAHAVSVKISNFNGLLSTAVSVDGQLQGYQPPATSGGIQFAGTEDLTNVGVSAIQANNVQTALQKFAPSAAAVTITNAQQAPIDPERSSQTVTYTFAVKIDNKTYNARLDCINLSTIQLFLVDTKTDKQVFDSGTITAN